MSISTKLALAAICAALAAMPARARGRVHHHPRASARSDGYPRGYGGSYSETQGGAVAAATARAYREPGVTQELAPDAKQSATGGPSGGVPGFSGGM